MPGAALCPRCGAFALLGDETWQRFGTAMRTWYDTGTATVDCPACATAVAVPDWAWDEAPLAFGCPGFEFWNRPDLTDAFRARPARAARRPPHRLRPGQAVRTRALTPARGPRAPHGGRRRRPPP
ncbi:hypothetical protein GCM10023238_40440 [Streptomyces heliomycini]